MTPHDITANSHKQVWWRCQDNPKHQWRATVHNRIGNDSGCPNCQESRGERAIRQYLKTRGRKCKAQRRVRGVGRFDFLTKTDRWVVIEYH
ncbi:zinc-ribbon domain-containing protein, partial [Acinetobacter baumannii]